MKIIIEHGKTKRSIEGRLTFVGVPRISKRCEIVLTGISGANHADMAGLKSPSRRTILQTRHLSPGSATSNPRQAVPHVS